jgi:hypothetical protein
MTIEGRPEISGADDFNDRIYKTARKDRLVDIISDYVTDESTNPNELYDDVMSEIDIWIKYHEKNLQKAQKVKETFQQRTYQIHASQFLAEDRISNYPYENISTNPVVTLGQDPVIFGA